MELLVENHMGAEVGDEVVVEVPDHYILKSAFKLYGLPMLLFFAVGTVAYLLSPLLGLTDVDLWAALSGIAAVVLYYVAIGSGGEGSGREKVRLNAHIVRIQTHHHDSPLACHQP